MRISFTGLLLLPTHKRTNIIESAAPRAAKIGVLDVYKRQDVVTALLINSPRLQQMSERAREWHVDGAADIVNSLIEILDASAQDELVKAQEAIS